MDVVRNVDGEETWELVGAETTGTGHMTLCKNGGTTSETESCSCTSQLFGWHETHWRIPLAQTQRTQWALSLLKGQQCAAIRERLLLLLLLYDFLTLIQMARINIIIANTF